MCNPVIVHYRSWGEKASKESWKIYPQRVGGWLDPSRIFRRTTRSDVGEGKPLLGLATPLTGHALAGRDLGHQIEDVARSVRRVREDLLVQPLPGRDIQACCLVLEEQKQELPEKDLDQGLETLVVIHERGAIH
jgi:hypothetical protein